MFKNRTHLLSHFIGLALVLSIIALEILSSVLAEQDLFWPRVDRALLGGCMIYAFRWSVLTLPRLLLFLERDTSRTVVTITACSKEIFQINVICVSFFCVLVLFHCYATSSATGFDLTYPSMLLLTISLLYYHIFMFVVFARKPHQQSNEYP